MEVIVDVSQFPMRKDEKRPVRPISAPNFYQAQSIVLKHGRRKFLGRFVEFRDGRSTIQ